MACELGRLVVQVRIGVRYSCFQLNSQARTHVVTELYLKFCSCNRESLRMDFHRECSTAHEVAKYVSKKFVVLSTSTTDSKHTQQ